MGKGRVWSSALRSRVTPTGRWAPKANHHAVCVGMALHGKAGGGRNGAKMRFIEASRVTCRGK